MGGECKVFPKKNSARFARDSSIFNIFKLALLALNYNYLLTTVQFHFFAARFARV